MSGVVDRAGDRRGRVLREPRIFTVLFEGLICHVGPDDDPDKKERAVLLDDKPTHRPFIQISRDDLINPNDPEEISLEKRDDVSFEGLPAGAGRPQADFKQFVPGLRDLLKDGGLVTLVRQGKHGHAKTLGYVTYPEGLLTAPEVLDNMLKFTLHDGSTIRHCIAAGVQFTAMPVGNTVTVVITHHKPNGDPNGTQRVPIRATATIKIVNVSGAGNHWQLYRGITTSTHIASATEDKDSPCSDLKTERRLFTLKATEEDLHLARTGAQPKKRNRDGALVADNPECTNSGWP